MSREEFLLKYVDRGTCGIEIAPNYNPLLRKSDGHNILTMDVFDSSTLREFAEKDLFIPRARIADIEEVDLIGNAIDIQNIVAEKRLLGKIGFIVSSHNFEHLPDPIRFLQGCWEVLAPNGVLSMAIPDYRASFDHFRSPTTLAEWLEAYFERRMQPTLAQVFDQRALRADYYGSGAVEPQPGCGLSTDLPTYFRPLHEVKEAFSVWTELNISENVPYLDAHCSKLFGKTLELMLNDLTFLGLNKLQVIEISATQHHEFFAHLRKTPTNPAFDGEGFYQRRDGLLQEINQQLGWWAYPAWRSQHERDRFSTGDVPIKKTVGARIGRELRRAVRRAKRMSRSL